jgi:hypothetical protein
VPSNCTANATTRVAVSMRPIAGITRRSGSTSGFVTRTTNCEIGL